MSFCPSGENAHCPSLNAPMSVERRKTQFIQNHPMIKITRGGEVKEYELFAVKVTDTDDEAYRLDFDDGEFEELADAMGAPANTVEILTLSTCLGNEDDLRLLVQGAITK